MIPQYSDYAANERTFLAWVRTALSMVAFGGALAKFDLFLRFITPNRTPLANNFYSPTAAKLGIGFVILGVVLMIASYHRFRKNRVAIGAIPHLTIAGSGLEGFMTSALIILSVLVLTTLLWAVPL